MASEDALRLCLVTYLFVYYKLDVLRAFYRAHSKSLPDIMCEKIGQNQVSTSLIRYQNRLLVPGHESRYMKVPSIYRGSSLWNFVDYDLKEAPATLNCRSQFL